MLVSVTVTDSREAQIADAIRSIVDHVDLVLLLDTGITDSTIERAREVAGEKLVVAKHSWVDFSTARNAGLEEAKKLGADWIIIVDSDERLDFGTRDLRTTLANTHANVLQIESSDGHYPKDKILRASSSMHFVGPTHETLLCSGPREILVDSSFFELSKSEDQLKQKFARDLKLLLDYTKEHPDDPRWWYYLGASYEGLGNHNLAAVAFGECIERRHLAGEEAAWAGYKQAEQLFILERYNESIAAAARGMGADSTFGECAWIAAVASYRSGRIDQSVAWARAAEAVGRYKGCGSERAWFRHLPALYELPYDVLRYALTDGAARQQAETDFYLAKRTRVQTLIGKQDLDWLSVSRSVSVENREEARSMLWPPTLGELCSSARSTRIQFDPPNGYRPMNPSICRHNGEIWCVVRTVNYSVERGQYTYASDGIVRTENYLGRLLPGGELAEPELMRDLDTSRVRQPSRIVGYEDIRLVSLGDELTASATVCDHDPNRRMMARLHLSDDGDVERAVVQATNQEHEKNWMPLSVGGALTWIYSLDPTAILPGPLNYCSFALENLRGGAAVAFQEGYLCVTHEVIPTNEGRIYLHRFVQLDAHFYVVSVSKAWVFAHHGVEFCVGLVVDNDDIIMSYGVEDREAWIVRVPSTEVLNNVEWFTAKPRRTRNTSHARAICVAVVNSPHERCGVREYGIQLNRSLSKTVDLKPYTYADVTEGALAEADIILVHFEGSLVSHEFYETLLAAKQSGAKVVFCCHNYGPDIVAKFLPLVDRFVLHRPYGDAPPNSVEIPLGCPVYVPTESRKQIRARLELPDDKLVVTSLGFLAEWKRWGEIVEAVAEKLSGVAFLQIHTATPYYAAHHIERETARIQAALRPGSGRHTTTFEPERELIDRVYASDLGFIFHPIHTRSVSAATKQFVSGRCPLVVTGSSHSSDLQDGVIRVSSLDPHEMAKEIRRVVDDPELRARMASNMEREYERLNMDAAAEQYMALFKELIAWQK